MGLHLSPRWEKVLAIVSAWANERKEENEYLTFIVASMSDYSHWSCSTLCGETDVRRVQSLVGKAPLQRYSTQFVFR